jgi:hypothetical protein
MTNQDLESQLLTLSSADQADVIQRLAQALSLNGRGITKTPGVCGGEACIDGPALRFGFW